LRRWQRADAEALYRAVTDSMDHLIRWMPWAVGYTRESAAEFIASAQQAWETGREYSYAITVDGAIAGAVGLRSQAEPDRMEIGYWVHRAYTRRGLATTAAGALTEQALLLPDIERVEIYHDPRNLASAGVPRKLGYTKAPGEAMSRYGHLISVWFRLPDDTESELTEFMRAYERATNSHDIARVVPLIAADATYWFTDGSYHGREAVTQAIKTTFASIQDEVYQISDLEWITCTHEQAVCRYRFVWTGTVAGEPRSGTGRGTNVIVRRDGGWQMLHEHLSA
jgi:RimJ/RimL family protein N-acetyltransferase/ketosteroid isomerase-like protein